MLIQGESGTGKELVAQAIHAESNGEKPFIAINCGSIPKDLIESELFGYSGRSFTGANKQGTAGKFGLAKGGTIFLDEIGEMPKICKWFSLGFLKIDLFQEWVLPNK